MELPRGPVLGKTFQGKKRLQAFDSEPLRTAFLRLWTCDRPGADYACLSSPSRKCATSSGHWEDSGSGASTVPRLGLPTPSVHLNSWGRDEQDVDPIIDKLLVFIGQQTEQADLSSEPRPGYCPSGDIPLCTWDKVSLSRTGVLPLHTAQ